MTDENDGKDENQLRKGLCLVAATLLWPLAFFFSVAIPVWFFTKSNLGPIAVAYGLVFNAIPAGVIGAILGIFFGAPRLANWALLVILCLGLMTYALIRLDVITPLIVSDLRHGGYLMLTF